MCIFFKMVYTQSYKQALLIFLDRIRMLYQFYGGKVCIWMCRCWRSQNSKGLGLKQAVKHLMEIYAYFPLGFLDYFFGVIICTKQLFGVYWLVGFIVVFLKGRFCQLSQKVSPQPAFSLCSHFTHELQTPVSPKSRKMDTNQNLNYCCFF